MPYPIAVLSMKHAVVSGLDCARDMSDAHWRSRMEISRMCLTPGSQITVTSQAWREIEIDDEAISDARICERSARRGAGDTIPHEVFDAFVASTRFELECAAAAEGPDGQIHQLIGFRIPTNLTDRGAAFGLACIGPQDRAPRPGLPLTVLRTQDIPEPGTYGSPLCFTKGTMIGTPLGEVSVEDLAVGDMVSTLERGPEPVRWIGTATVPAKLEMAPVEFAPGALGQDRMLRVGRNQRLLLSGWQVELFFGEESVWAPASSFLDCAHVRVAEGGYVSYYGLLLNRHSTLLAEGIEVESLHPGDIALGEMSASAKADLFTAFPEVERMSGTSMSHTVLQPAEVQAILAL